ncbi:hypothetical protein BU23DRAFT_326336 [Bimuria novae-zelandiae CBS 107.79]|uniref:Uncharacterized protein n=1 Tax=Bimuria novae-zelandiae CBS 107.79 TaxID=1447943 RepID=A0A6A5UPX6_9PLEO|nr:hypothetical protein BU23DRAFT_326336 [Bimuria novae-zelandiae CBS 107.79]
MGRCVPALSDCARNLALKVESSTLPPLCLQPVTGVDSPLIRLGNAPLAFRSFLIILGERQNARLRLLPGRPTKLPPTCLDPPHNTHLQPQKYLHLRLLLSNSTPSLHSTLYSTNLLTFRLTALSLVSRHQLQHHCFNSLSSAYDMSPITFAVAMIDDGCGNADCENRKKLVRNETELSQAKKMVSKADRKLKDKKGQLFNVRIKAHKLEKAVVTAYNRSTDAETQTKELETGLSRMEDLLTVKDNQNTDDVTKVNEFETELSCMKDLLTAKDDQHTNTITKTKELETELARTKDLLAAKDIRHTDAVTKVNELETGLSRMKDPLAAKNDHHTGAAEVQKLTDELATLKKNARPRFHLQAQLNFVTASEQKLKDNLTVMKTQLTAAAASEQVLKDHLIAATVSNEELKKQLTAKDDQYTDAAAEVQKLKDELSTLKNARPRFHLQAQLTAANQELATTNNDLVTTQNELKTAKEELKTTKEEAARHQKAAISAHKDAVQAHQQRGQLQSRYAISQHTVDYLNAHNDNLNAERTSIQATLHHTTEALRAMHHDLASAKANAIFKNQELDIQKKFNDATVAKLTQAQSTIAILSSDLDTIKIELAAFRKPTATDAPSSKSTQGSNTPAQSTNVKLAAWGNAQAVIRADDVAVRRANDAKAEKMTDLPRGELITIYKPTGEAARKQTSIEAIECLLGGLKGEQAASSAEISALRKGLAAEQSAHSEMKLELRALQSALGSTQVLVKDTRAELAAVQAAKDAMVRVGCSCSSDLRAARASQVALGEELDKVNWKAIELTSSLHDALAGVIMRSGTPELVSESSSDGSESSDSEVVFVGTDGAALPREEEEEMVEMVEMVEWSAYTPPHLRKSRRAALVSERGGGGARGLGRGRGGEGVEVL